MRSLIGIDDMDNSETGGTPVTCALTAQNLVEVEGITRNQLLVDPRIIRYTSHNSSACLTVIAHPDRLTAPIETCRQFLATVSAPGSAAGLCVAEWSRVNEAVQHFGVLFRKMLSSNHQTNTTVIYDYST